MDTWRRPSGAAVTLVRENVGAVAGLVAGAS